MAAIPEVCLCPNNNGTGAERQVVLWRGLLKQVESNFVFVTFFLPVLFVAPGACLYYVL